MSRVVLDAIHAEMQAQWAVEQEVSGILPVHNIGALSLDTISLKNVLRAESRASKMLYAQMLLAHAAGLLKGMLREVERDLSIILHKRKTKTEANVQELVQLLCVLSNADQFEKRHEGNFSIVQHVLDWTEECKVVADALRLDLEKLRANLAEINDCKPFCRRLVAQDREKMMGQLALDAEAVEKDTDALFQDLLDPQDGPLVPQMPTDTACARLNKLKPRLEGLEKRWQRIKDAEHALELTHSNSATFSRICSIFASFEALFRLHFEALEKLEPILLQPIADIHSHINALNREQANLLLSLREMQQHGVTKTLTYEKLLNKLNQMGGNLEVLRSTDTLFMQAYHWHAVFAKAVPNRKGSDSFMIAHFDVYNLPESPMNNGLSPATPVQDAPVKVLIKDVMAHDLTAEDTVACLERMTSLASKEKEVRKLLQFLEFHWRGEEWVFRTHMTSSGKMVFVVDYHWAAEIVQELERSVLSLSVQVAAVALGSNGTRHALDEDPDGKSDGQVSQLQVEVEAWREALVGSSLCVQELVIVQSEWTALQCLYHDPEIRLKQPKETRQFLHAEQQLLTILRQMKEARGVLHYCASRDPLALLVPLHNKLDTLAKMLSTSLDHQRCLFPRLFFMGDKDMIALQYSCVNDESKLKDFLPKLFTGICDISWEPNQPNTEPPAASGWSENVKRRAGAAALQDHAYADNLALNSQRFPLVQKSKPAGQSQQKRIFIRTMSGTSHVKRVHEQKTAVVSKASDPRFQRLARQRPAGVVDSSGQILLFLQEVEDVEEADETAASSPRGQEDESKLNRFLQLVLSRTSEQMKQDLFEARDKLLLADKDWSMHMDQEQLEAIISSHAPQSIHLALRIMWTAGVEQKLEQSQASALASRGASSSTFDAAAPAASLVRYLESASKGLVSTADALVGSISRLRMKHVHLTRRIAGMVCLLLYLRDKTDELLANPRLARASDFAWLKVPRFYWDPYQKNAWMSILDTTQPCRGEWQGSNPPIIVLTPSAERALMGITQAASNGRGALLLVTFP